MTIETREIIDTNKTSATKALEIALKNHAIMIQKNYKLRKEYIYYKELRTSTIETKMQERH
jgi:hypothetical protein